MEIISIPKTYDWLLILLSYVVAGYASLTALQFSTKIHTSPRHLYIWQWAAAFSLGLGIWSMHFVGMLALVMPVEVQYDPFLTLLSLLFAIAVSWLAYRQLVARDHQSRNLVIAAGFIAAGIAGMHYLGMHAMRMDAVMIYDARLVVLSVVIAFGTAYAALQIFSLINRKNVSSVSARLFTAAVMALAVCGMHYTGMAAVQFQGIPDLLSIEGSSLNAQILAAIIAFSSLLVCALGYASTMLDNSSDSRKRMLFLSASMISIIMLVVLVDLGLFYSSSLTNMKTRLQEISTSNAQLLSSVARFDQKNSQNDHSRGARGATISQFINARLAGRADDDNLDYVLFESKEGDIHLLHNDLKDSVDAGTSAFNTYLPFINALADSRGTVISQNPFNHRLSAVSYTYIPELAVGIAAFAPLSGIFSAFLQTALITLSIAVILIAFGLGLFYSVSNPILEQLTSEIEERKSAEKQLQQSNDRLEQKVQERTSELSDALNEVKAAAKAKSEFLANMSHEIRTPMNGVLGMLDLLCESDLNNEQSEFAKTGVKSAKSLLVILNDILDLSKIEAGKIELEQIEFNLRDVVEDVADLLAEPAHRKQLELTTRIATNVPEFIIGDETRLRQILSNLVSNAIKFTETGEVIVTCLLEKCDNSTCSIRFEISDTGIGIAPEQQQKVFEAFSQEDGSTTRRYGGTGLGLSISRQLCLLMDGDIGVRSHPNAGSTFWFTISSPISTRKEYSSIDTSLLSYTRILIADDNATNREVLASHLKNWGFQYDFAKDGRQAVEMVHQQALADTPYALVLMDMMMPYMSGLEASRSIKENSLTAGTKIIILSSVTESHERRHSKEIGVSEFITKPIRKRILLNAILSSLSNASVAQSSNTTIQTPDMATSHSHKILVVEDNGINQRVITAMLVNAGVEYDTANNGKEALELIENTQYDLIFMDCQMPVMDGFEATRQLKQGDYKAPVIAMTANAMQGDKEACLESGMDDYLAKPISSMDVTAILAKWLPKQRDNMG